MAISQPLLKTKTTWYVAAAIFLILSIKPTYKALRKWGYSQVTETANFFETIGTLPE